MPRLSSITHVAAAVLGFTFVAINVLVIHEHNKTTFQVQTSSLASQFFQAPSKTMRGKKIPVDKKFKIQKEAHEILSSPKLPDWVKKYAEWHRQQRHKYFEARRNNETSDVRFFIVRCYFIDTCGGASDRLQDIPYNLMMANQTDRVLLIKWEKPAPLENFLVPPEGGIDWTVPDEMFDKRRDLSYWGFDRKLTREDKIVSHFRRNNGALKFRKYEDKKVGHRIYHETFHLLFKPSPALAERVYATMNELNLTPSNYSSVHLRVKYPVSGIDEKSFSFQKHKSMITGWATNAVNCAAELHPNSTIYVSSDNNDTVGYLLEESPFAEHSLEIEKKKREGLPAPPSVVKLVARDYSKENRHLEFSRRRDAEGFMNVFEDMMIMSLGRCVSHGVGGFGRLAGSLTGGECVSAHRGRNSKTCSDVLKINANVK